MRISSVQWPEKWIQQSIFCFGQFGYHSHVSFRNRFHVCIIYICNMPLPVSSDILSVRSIFCFSQLSLGGTASSFYMLHVCIVRTMLLLPVISSVRNIFSFGQLRRHTCLLPFLPCLWLHLPLGHPCFKLTGQGFFCHSISRILLPAIFLLLCYQQWHNQYASICVLISL